MNLLRAASHAHEWDINLGELARIWKGGCIIRAQFLGPHQGGLRPRRATSPNLLLDPGFREGARRAAGRLAEHGHAGDRRRHPLMTMGGSLGYYDSIRRERLPANLTQAQRDYFGAHTYERIDKPGTFHTEWTK